MKFTFSSNKQYWAALKNMHATLTSSTDEGRKLRMSFLNRTGDKKFKESNYQKMIRQGKTYSLKDIRLGYKAAKVNFNETMKAEWEQIKKDKRLQFKNFREFNKYAAPTDYDSIRESFNSPH